MLTRCNIYYQLVLHSFLRVDTKQHQHFQSIITKQYRPFSDFVSFSICWHFQTGSTKKWRRLQSSYQTVLKISERILDGFLRKTLKHYCLYIVLCGIFFCSDQFSLSHSILSRWPNHCSLLSCKHSLMLFSFIAKWKLCLQKSNLLV